LAAVRCRDSQRGSRNPATTPTCYYAPWKRCVLNYERCIIALSTSPDTAALNNADDTPKKQTASKRKFLDFSCALSIDNQLFSGDESDRWEDEQNNVFGIIAAQNILEQDAGANLNDPVEEVQEFEHLLSNIEGEEGNPDDASEEVDEYESVVVTLKTNMCRS
jgi:hypothetical protein